MAKGCPILEDGGNVEVAEAVEMQDVRPPQRPPSRYYGKPAAGPAFSLPIPERTHRIVKMYELFALGFELRFARIGS